MHSNRVDILSTQGTRAQALSGVPNTSLPGLRQGLSTDPVFIWPAETTSLGRVDIRGIYPV